MKKKLPIFKIIGLVLAFVSVIVAIVGIILDPSTNKTDGENIFSPEGSENINIQSNGTGNKIEIIQKEPSKYGIIWFLNEQEIHLGDNVYSQNGLNYNAQHKTISSQKSSGIIFLDKENENYLAGAVSPLEIQRIFVSEYREKISDCDFSNYKRIKAIAKTEKNIKNLLSLGVKFQSFSGNLLYEENEKTKYLKESFGFYDRYAAIAFVKDFRPQSVLLDNGITEKEFLEAEITLIFDGFHSGIRFGQAENFYFSINEENFEIKTVDKEIRNIRSFSIKIPSELIKFKENNHFSFYVLPWEEKAPKLWSDKLNRQMGQFHFRDIGVKNAYLSVVTK